MTFNTQASYMSYNKFLSDESTIFKPIPIRKTHAKSRRGCTTCKQRHLRCDEAFPRCYNCFKHRSECHYPKAHYLAKSQNKVAVENQSLYYNAPTDRASSVTQGYYVENSTSVDVRPFQDKECRPGGVNSSPRGLGSYPGASNTVALGKLEQLALCKYASGTR